MDGTPQPVRGLRRRAVLAALALRAGEVVSTGELVDVVWAAGAPPTAVNTLQSHVSYLRNLLGHKAAILARPPGYLLDLGSDATDVQVAERLLRQGGEAGTGPDDAARRVRDLRTALELWRGQPLADVTGSAGLEEEALRLDTLRGTVERALAQARLAAGEHLELVPDLEQLAAGHPLDEQVCGQLMLALYRSGRQADALAAYHRLRGTLDEELGIGPGQALRDLEVAILQQDPALLAPPAAPPAGQPAVRQGQPPTGAPEAGPRSAAPPADPQTVRAGRPGPQPASQPRSPATPVPAQLPPAVPGFAGRDAALASLDGLLPGEAGDAPAAVVISAVLGTAGVGKTALAVHWGHRVAARFPDGQLYVNLRGYDPSGVALDPAEAVRGFLDALGVTVARIPQGFDAQCGLYRSMVAGKRILVMLDNARDAEQVRPLLPGSPGCLAIVTSRDQLAGLLADGASPVSLDLLTLAEAHDLLAGRLGAGRVAAEPEAAQEIIERCARLPLALAIAASRAATTPGFPLAAVAAELRQASTLDPFDGGDLATDVRAVFSWSYRSLSPSAARLFRLLGPHPGPDISVTGAASLAAILPGQARTLLAELCRANLLSQDRPGRYTFHDLLCAYATEQGDLQDSPGDRDAALRRVLDHYLHTAHNAVLVMEPYRDPLPLTRTRPEVIVGEPASTEDALAWFAAEHATLLAAVRFCAGAGFPGHAWQLASILSYTLLRRGLWDDQTTVCQVALDAARRSGDVRGQAHSLYRMASGYARSGRDGEALPMLLQALGQFEATGDHTSQAAVQLTLGWLAVRQQRYTDGLGHSLRAHELYRVAGHRVGQARVLNNIGYSHALLGNYAEALTYCERSQASIEELGDRRWDDYATWDSLGYIHQQLGNHQQAVRCYQRATEGCRARGDRYNEAVTLDHLADVHDSAGEAADARRAWEAALCIFTELDHPDGDKVRAKLRERRPATAAR